MGATGVPISARAFRPISASNICKAAIKYAQKRMGSLSPSSNETQVTQRSLCGIHSLSSVVFPYPAGAEMRVSLRPEG